MKTTSASLPRAAHAVVVLVLVHLIGLGICLALLDPIVDRLLRPDARSTVGVLRWAVPAVDVSIGLLCLAAAVQVARVRGTVKGKARVWALAAIGSVHFGLMAATIYVALGACLAHRGPLFSRLLDPAEVLYVLSPETARLVRDLGSAAVGTAGILAADMVGVWFLLPEKFRRRFFLVFDAAATVAFVYATFRLPLSPDPDVSASLKAATIRHALTGIFAARLYIRLVPPLLDAFQGISPEALVATRHLRSEKSGFLAFISILSVLAVASSTCVLAVVLSILGGFRGDLERKILGSSAHVVVDRPAGPIERWDDTLRRVRETPGIVAASPYVQAEVMITSASNFAGALLRGIDPEQATRVNDIARILREDRRKARGSLDLLRDPARIEGLTLRERCPGAARDALIPDVFGSRKPDTARTAGHEERVGILIGSELARSLRLCVGDDLDVVSPLGDLGPAGPMPKTREFRVAGIFHSGMYEYDMKHVYVLLDVARSFLRMGDAISGIEARTARVEESSRVAATLRTRLGRNDLRVEDWRRRNQSLFGALSLEKLLFSFTFGITVLIAGCCVFATITLMVFEKRRQVGILKALGASDRSIVAVFLSEGMLIGLLGASAGLGLGGLLCFAVEHFGLQMNAEIIYLDRLPVDADPLEFLAVGAAALAVSALSTLAPALHASRMRPVDAVRND